MCSMWSSEASGFYTDPFAKASMILLIDHTARKVLLGAS